MPSAAPKRFLLDVTQADLYLRVEGGDVATSASHRGSASGTERKQHMREELLDVHVDENVTDDSDIDRNTVAASRLAQNRMKGEKKNTQDMGHSDTYVGTQSLQAALCAAGAACRAVDLVMQGESVNAFVCARPPGHHSGRYGCTAQCLTSGFCLINNAAIAVNYCRVKYGLSRIAIVDIDVHFGNGTADIVRHDPNTFFSSVHMIFGSQNTSNYFPCCGFSTNGGGVNAAANGARDGARSNYFPSCNNASRHENVSGFYPNGMGATEITDNYICVGVFPDNWRTTNSKAEYQSAVSQCAAAMANGTVFASKDSDSPVLCQPAYLSGSKGFRHALNRIIIPAMEKFNPEFLIISGMHPRLCQGNMCYCVCGNSWFRWIQDGSLRQ